MPICPVCRYRGARRTCPRDGFPMVSDALMTPSDESHLVGRVIAERYEVVAPIGEGGMGWVYEGRHTGTGRAVALKVMRPEFVRNDGELRRFYREVRTHGKLQSPHTVRVFDFGISEDGQPFMAMELLEGSSLRRVLRGHGRLHAGRAAHVTRQICRSLEEAHHLGIVHRDLKPDNVFIAYVTGERDYVKILDFGIARIYEGRDDFGSLTATGVLLGTPQYMSPEQVRGEKLDGRADLFSLGVMLYEMLAGVLPFEAHDTEVGLAQRETGRFIPVAAAAPPGAVPEALDQLVTDLLAPQRDKRPATARDVADRLAGLPWELGADDHAAASDGLPAMPTLPIPPGGPTGGAIHTPVLDPRGDLPGPPTAVLPARSTTPADDDGVDHDADTQPISRDDLLAGIGLLRKKPRRE